MEPGADPLGLYRPQNIDAEALPTADELFEELIKLCLEVWLSRAEELTRLEVAHRFVGNLDAATTLCTSDIDPACALPVPLSDEREGLPEFTKFRAKRLDEFVRDHGALRAQVTNLLDEHIITNCQAEFLDSVNTLEEDLARMEFYKKVELCAKHRLVNHRFATHPHLDRFKFGVCYIDQNGQVVVAWRYLDWDCTSAEVRVALDNHARSDYLPRDTLPLYIRSLQALDHEDPLSLTALRAARLIEDLEFTVDHEGDRQVAEGDGRFAMISECDRLLAVAYPDFSEVSNDAFERVWGDMSLNFDLDVCQVRREQDFIRCRDLVQQNRHCPIVVKPWQLRFLEVIRRYREVTEN